MILTRGTVAKRTLAERARYERKEASLSAAAARSHRRLAAGLGVGLVVAAAVVAATLLGANPLAVVSGFDPDGAVEAGVPARAVESTAMLLWLAGVLPIVLVPALVTGIGRHFLEVGEAQSVSEQRDRAAAELEAQLS